MGFYGFKYKYNGHSNKLYNNIPNCSVAIGSLYLIKSHWARDGNLGDGRDHINISGMILPQLI